MYNSNNINNIIHYTLLTFATEMQLTRCEALVCFTLLKVVFRNFEVETVTDKIQLKTNWQTHLLVALVASMFCNFQKPRLTAKT